MMNFMQKISSHGNPIITTLLDKKDLKVERICEKGNAFADAMGKRQSTIVLDVREGSLIAWQKIITKSANRLLSNKWKYCIPRSMLNK